MGCGTSFATPVDNDRRNPTEKMYPVASDIANNGKQDECADSRRFNSTRPNGKRENSMDNNTHLNGGDQQVQRRLSKPSSLTSNNAQQTGKPTAAKKSVKTVGSFDLDSQSSDDDNKQNPTSGTKKSDEWSFSCKDNKNESLLGDDEMGNDRVKNLAFESQEMGGGLAQFHNQPQECAGCGTAGVAYTCDTCESYFLCEDCRFTDAIIGQHDTSHTIVPIQEGHCNSSRTFGGDSYSMTADGGNSYLFYNPCSTCKKVIDDTEVVYRCEQCNFLVCENCYGDPNSEHEHDLHRFQRRTRNSSVQETVLKNKSRSSDGNRIINDYVVVGVLGKGSYAKVKLVQHINTRELYALKIIKRKRSNRSSTSNSLKKSSVKSTEMNQDDLLREIAVMKFIDHPNVVQLKEVIEDTDLSRVYVIMEYCEKGPVHVLGNPPLSLETTRNYGCDILKGILHLHHEYLYHRDIKPANCLVDSLDTAKLADFGTCSSIVKQDTQQTPAFQCPETVRGDGDNVTGNVVDSWSFALTVYQMAFGSLPFDISSFGKLRQQIIGPEKVFIPEDCDPTLKDVLTRMLEKDIEKRMLVAEAASHPFFGLDQDGNECSRRMSTSNVDMKPKVNEELYTRAAQEIRHGKNLNDCFHGIRAIRRMRRKEVNKANYSGAPTGAEEEDDDWLNELDSLNNSNSNFPNRNDAASSTANGEYGMSELVEQASVALSVSKSTRARGASAQGASTEKVKEVIQNLVQNNDKDTVLRLIKIPFATPPPQITEVSSFATELRMAHNGLLKAGPIDYSVFKMLKDITINGNKLTAFPEEVLMAPRLLRLDLSSNRITSIPPTIRQARFLQRLNLQNNLITDVGVDNNGNSVLAGPSLRHVRLSTNPVKHIPKALETTTNLSLVLDTIPALMAEWNKVVQENKSKPPAVVIWDDYFPEVIKDTKPPVWIASNYLSLYRAHTLETCNVQHVVLLQNSDKRFPKGLFSSHDLTVYFAKLASRVGDIVHDKENSNPSSPTAGDHNDMVRSAVASALCTLPPVVNRFARERIQSYYFVSENETDREGGYNELVEHCYDVLSHGDSIILFLPPSKEDNESKDVAIGGISEALHKLEGGSTEQQLKTIVRNVTEAARQLYN